MQPTHQIDEIIASALRLRPDCVPGERLVAGKPYIYDLNLRRSFEAREAVRSAPANLSRLSDDQLDALVSAGLRRWADTSRRDHAAGELAERCITEQRARAALVTIPALAPITATVRQLDPAIWGAAVFMDAAE